MLYQSLLCSLLAAAVKAGTVGWDSRAVLIDGKRTILMTAVIHYPRGTPSEWKPLMEKAKASGIDLIQTYVFWDIHEPVEGEYDFTTGRRNLVAFIETAQEVGLYVNLRIGPYVCAEWNYGGFPTWLRNYPDMVFRTEDDTWYDKMGTFVTKVVDLVREAGQLYSQGGPIVLLQVENEYGNIQSPYGQGGRNYVEWCAQLARDQGLDEPWIMCNQGEGVGSDAPADIINTCNGMFCGNWISKHVSSFPEQPHMFTEMWPGWYQEWGDAMPRRPAADCAYSVAEWFMRGGSYMAYYPWFGGTNLERTVGGPMIVTSYDYSVHLDEHVTPTPNFVKESQSVVRTTLVCAPPTDQAEDAERFVPETLKRENMAKSSNPSTTARQGK